MSVPNKPLQIDLGVPSISDAEALQNLWKAQSDWFCFVGPPLPTTTDTAPAPLRDDSREDGGTQ